MLVSILCMLYLSTQAGPEVSAEGLTMCPSDWLYWDGSCYRAFSSVKSWNESSTFCHENQGELVSMNSDAEQKFVYQNMAVGKTLWIGLVKDRALRIFRWSNGEDLTFENWIKEPDISGKEDCGEMTDYSQFHGQWNDKSCSTKQPFICEKGGMFGLYFKRLPRKQLMNHVIDHVIVSSDLECLFRCQRHKNCLSVNYRQEVQLIGVCELNDASGLRFPGKIMDSKEYDYFEIL